MSARRNFKKINQAVILLGIVLFINTSCKKKSSDPSVNGTWREMKSPTDTSLTGCTLEIDEKNGNVAYCGIPLIHPHDVTAYILKSSAKLVIQGGQMYYHERKETLFYVVPIVYDDLYFMDYELDGDYLWIIGDDSKSKTAVKGVAGAKVFRR